ncbi:MAG: ion transporter [Crocinitomicaceae bacterium]
MRGKLYSVIFGINTKSGRRFDIVLLLLILLSVLIIMFESVPTWSVEFPEVLFYAEWVFTIIFTIEYILRIIISPKPLKYILSWWGLIDLVSILPTFIGPFISGYTSLRAIRALRLLRFFRILKLSRFTSESQSLGRSLKASYYKIMVFLFFVVMMMVMAGTLMYVIEVGTNGFESIPASIYWAIVTTTTVGYGDITPATDIGKIIASIMMIVGYVIIAVPTGLISIEMAKNNELEASNDQCGKCGNDNPILADYCNKCGGEFFKDN